MLGPSRPPVNVWADEAAPGPSQVSPTSSPQPDPSQDPFDLLGVPPTFRLDGDALRRAWLVRAAGAHPDAAGEASAGLAASLNDARATLADPEARANALLARLGGPSKEADNRLPDGFLVEIMGVREELEAAEESGDAAELARLWRWAEEAREGHIAAVGEAFDVLGQAPAADALAAIRRELNAWRYIERMLEQIGPGGPTG